MNSATKIQVARVTLSLLLLVATLFMLGVVVLVVCAGLQVNPFKETTTSFLIAAFVGLIGVALVLVLLNVATNLSLIADVQAKDMAIDAGKSWLRKWFWGFTATGIALVGFIFLGTYLSKERYVRVVRTQADEVLRDNTKLLDEISQLLASGKRDDFQRIAQIESFLTSQRQNLPQLSVIYSGKFGDKPAFYRTYMSYEYVPYSPDSKESKEYVPKYFSCQPKQDCEYLTKFFAGEKADVLEKYHLRDDEFFIYIPFVGKETRFVLLFQRQNSYGKFGS